MAISHYLEAWPLHTDGYHLKMICWGQQLFPGTYTWDSAHRSYMWSCRLLITFTTH